MHPNLLIVYWLLLSAHLLKNVKCSGASQSFEEQKSFQPNMDQTNKDLVSKKVKHKTQNANLNSIKDALLKFLSTSNTPIRTKKEAVYECKKKPKWHKWSKWSNCNVSCGRGRVIRWRHCKKNCEAETEMQEKSCQLPQCPRSLFGILKLPKLNDESTT